MKLSVGLLYTARDLLDLFSRHQIPETLHGLPGRSFVASYIGSVNIAMKCGWIELGEHAILQLSPRGQIILAETNIYESLRLQIEDFIEVAQPRWCKLIPHGRTTALNYMDADSRQCFREAELIESPPSDTVVDWWDRLASKSRGRQKDINNEIGRKGERLSIVHETKRVGKVPKWQAIESNADGYDILSSVSIGDNSRLTIEVKASRQPISIATFHITRNEWFFTETAASHRFHIWVDIDNAKPKFACLLADDIKHHIPANQGRGEWESVEIPCVTFAEVFV